MDGQPAT